MSEHPISNLHWYALAPLDVLLFRESKPFSPGDGSWAKGLFPPMPHAVFQALRSTLPTVATVDASNKLTFIGPFLARERPGGELELWLPTPKDLLAVRTGTRQIGNNQEDEAEATENLEDVAKTWERTARFQPCPQDQQQWKHIAFTSDLPGTPSLAPMVPPTPVEDELNGQRFKGNGQNDALRCYEQGTHVYEERVSGRLPPWIKASALVRYLKGEVLSDAADFTDDPWDLQILPHIKMQPGQRQVADADGYFTEVAVRLQPYWKLVAGISTKLEATAVRLGGEGHHALVEPLEQVPKDWKALEPFLTPPSAGTPCSAYVLTPGLAQIADTPLYGVFPTAWLGVLEGCVGDRPLLWGGMSVYRKEGKRETAFMPQRAFVVPGTVYRFKEPPSHNHHLLPQRTSAEGWQWVSVFEDLGYGTLLWERTTTAKEKA